MNTQSASLRAQDTVRKAEILRTACSLYARHGFGRVSLRDIAGELGISVGNLTYYFPHKTDLIDAVIDDLHRSTLPGGQLPENLVELRAFLDHYAGIMEDNVLFFNCSNICEGNAHMRSIQMREIVGLRKLWAVILQNLISAGLMAPPTYPGQYEALSTSIQLVFRHWAEFRRAESSIGSAPPFQSCIWSLLYPYFTEAGKKSLPVQF